MVQSGARTPRNLDEAFRLPKRTGASALRLARYVRGQAEALQRGLDDLAVLFAELQQQRLELLGLLLAGEANSGKGLIHLLHYRRNGFPSNRQTVSQSAWSRVTIRATMPRAWRSS